MKLKFGPTRDVVLLLAGLGLLGNEAFVVDDPRALIITIAAAMIGLPATLFADRKFVGTTPQEPEPPTQEPEQDKASPK